jgi:hypothetical protein
MNQVLDVIHWLHAFGLRTIGMDPLAAVVIAALVCALIEQRWRHRRTPDFSTAFRDINGRPDRPG